VLKLLAFKEVKFAPETAPIALDHVPPVIVPTEVNEEDKTLLAKVAPVNVPAAAITAPHVGVAPAPAEVSTCPDVPAEPWSCKGEVVPAKLNAPVCVCTPVIFAAPDTVNPDNVPTDVNEEERTFDARIVPVKVFELTEIAAQLGVAPGPPDVSTVPDEPTDPCNCNGEDAPAKLNAPVCVCVPVTDNADNVPTVVSEEETTFAANVVPEIAEPAIANVFHVGVTPAPADVRICPDEPGLPWSCKGDVAPE